MLKYFQQLHTTAIARVLFDLALLLVAISVVFNFFAWTQLTTIAKQNNHTGRIIKAATGCGETDSVAQCKKVVLRQSQNQLPFYLREQDCWTRRALIGLPAPASYTIPCQLPTIP